MDKQQRAASATDNADILTQVKTALKDESVITHIADRIATAVANTIIQRLDKLEAVLDEKNKKICHLEQTMVELEDKVDKLEKYSRRTSIRISGINENPGGENIETIMKTILVNMDVQDKINMQNIDRVHRIGQIKTTNTSNRPRQIIVKFKDYSSKDTVMKNRKLHRATRPDVYISEDLTQMRSRLLYVARTIKRERNIQDCWSYDGRITIKDLNGKIRSINTESDLNKL